ncbi:Bidirectional sugar transporter SWEET3b [Ananas comosus]|uniref:Bidirectional sugar transporter SWEET n=1 Tax=Ananas comosus TaxID=4615 RepID=A0A199V269_ANACO|nr:Bidirectional sugar transporter SWEET3b [Ananas comosus]
MGSLSLLFCSKYEEKNKRLFIDKLPGCCFAGNAASLLLYAAPILTFKRVIKKRSTEEFSCVPYIIAFLNCLLYTWYGLPVVSRGFENFPVITINAIGIVLETSFIFTYIWFALPERKATYAYATFGNVLLSFSGHFAQKTAILMMVPVTVLFTMTVFVSSFLLHDHRQRKVFVGSIGLVASISMYSSPLIAVKEVIKTRSVEFMPFYLSFFSFLASSLWLAYGLLGRDLFLAAPNFLGSPVGLLQLILYFIYRKNKAAPEELHEIDLNKNDLKTVPKQQEVNGRKLDA